VALRHRLSPVLPLSPTSREVCDPAVLCFVISNKPLTVPDELYSFSWATIIGIKGHGHMLSMRQGRLRARCAALLLAHPLANCVPQRRNSYVTR